MTLATAKLSEDIKYRQKIRHIIRSHLEQQKRQIAQQILHYPPPIPACDVQFNFLLEERARVGQMLRQVDTWSSSSPIDAQQIDWLNTFLTATPDLDSEIAQAVRAVMISDNEA